MKTFSLKFIDVMIGVVLGLGFQWWIELSQVWQYVAFVFVYLDVVDYWIDYAPSLKKFPPKKEIDIFLDLAIMFILFFYIYTTQLTIIHFLATFCVFKLLDYLWLWSSKREYHPTGNDKIFVNTWMKFNLVEIVLTVGLIVAFWIFSLKPLLAISIFIIFRMILRVLASFRYKKAHLI